MSSEKGVTAFPEDDNLFKWVGTIEGPQGTVSFVLYFIQKCEQILVSIGLTLL